MHETKDTPHPRAALEVGTRVDVHTRYESGRWASGFTIAEVRPTGYLVRRASDGAILSDTIRPDEIRVVTPAPTGCTESPRIPEGTIGMPSAINIWPEDWSRWLPTAQRRFTPSTPTHRGFHRSGPVPPTDAALRFSDVLVLESCHSTWIFDPLHLQYRRILKGVEVGHRSVVTEWRPYWQVEVDPEGEGFTVYLNSSGSHLIRSWRHTENCQQCSGSDTAELSMEDIKLTLRGIAGDTRERSPSQ